MFQIRQVSLYSHPFWIYFVHKIIQKLFLLSLQYYILFEFCWKQTYTGNQLTKCKNNKHVLVTNCKNIEIMTICHCHLFYMCGLWIKRKENSLFCQCFVFVFRGDILWYHIICPSSVNMSHANSVLTNFLQTWQDYFEWLSVCFLTIFTFVFLEIYNYSFWLPPLLCSNFSYETLSHEK